MDTFGFGYPASHGTWSEEKIYDAANNRALEPMDTDTFIIREKTIKDLETQYDEEARAIILEGLSQRGTVRRGSFAKYVE
jgi:hypothetical protein